MPQLVEAECQWQRLLDLAREPKSYSKFHTQVRAGFRAKTGDESEQEATEITEAQDLSAVPTMKTPRSEP